MWILGCNCNLLIGNLPQRGILIEIFLKSKDGDFRAFPGVKYGFLGNAFTEAQTVANPEPEAWLLTSLKERFKYSLSSDTSENT